MKPAEPVMRTFFICLVIGTASRLPVTSDWQEMHDKALITKELCFAFYRCTCANKQR